MHLLLVDDHRMFSDGLSVLLQELSPNIRITSALTIAQAEIQTEAFDLILLDLHLPDSFGFEGIKRLRSAHEASPIVVVSGEDSTSQIRECIAQGAMGFVSKSSNTEELFTAMKRILSGATYLPSHCLQVVNEVAATKAPIIVHGLMLTKRQHEVLAKVIQGKPNKVIARELDISDTTVKTHVLAVMAALGVHNRTEAVYKAAALGVSLSS
jgi:two-component system, NarL family, nitrate/nitrite response regulator NarL